MSSIDTVETRSPPANKGAQIGMNAGTTMATSGRSYSRVVGTSRKQGGRFGTRTIVLVAASVVILALGSACSSISPGNGMQREADFGAPSEVIDANETFQSLLSIPFEQSTDAEGTHTIEIPIEGSVPIYCFVWPHEAEMGATAVRSSAMIFEELRSNGFNSSGQQIVSVDSGAIGDAAYQSIKLTFQLADENEVGNGLMKVAAANRDGHGISCNHWDAGYSETFDRVFKELVGSFRTPDASPEPYYKEITTIRIGDLAVGIMTMTFTRDSEGDVQGIMKSSSVIPRSEREFLVTYSEITDWSNENGNLINAYVIQSDVDTEHTNLSLNWDSEQGWHVAGTFEGKEIDANLSHEGPIDSMLSDMIVSKYVLTPGGEHPSITLMRWITGADPTKAVEVPMTVDTEDDRYFTSRLGDLEIRTKRGADGLPETGTMRVGSNVMILERIYQNGEI